MSTVLLRPILRADILMGRDAISPLTPELEANLTILLKAANDLQTLVGRQLTVSSGYRPAALNKAAGGAKKSAHMLCQAVDFNDPDDYLDMWLFSRPQVLTDLNIYLEHSDYTPRWCHISIRPTKSGRRIFIP